MRVPNSKAYIQMIQAMGATTVAVDLSELYLALRQGVADGQDTPPSVVKSNKYYEVQKYISKTEHMLTTAYTVTNPKFYDRTRADEKTAFNSACKNAERVPARLHRQGRVRGLRFPQGAGHAGEPTPDIESFRVATGPVIEKNPDLFLPELVKDGSRHSRVGQRCLQRTP